nr:hypothetical protein [Candidatus Dependentiae bacterium]
GVWGPRFLLPVIPLLIMFIIMSYNNFNIKIKVVFWILSGIGLLVNLPALLYDFRIFCRTDDWEYHLKTLFIPHYSPVIKSFKYMYLNFFEFGKIELFSVSLAALIMVVFILNIFIKTDYR